MSYLVFIVIILLIWLLKRNFATIKGSIGERKVSKHLSTLDPNNYSLLNDLYIPKENGQTTQIDHILLSHKGIFVIETKNYNGWILGSEKSQHWTQVIYKRKEKFYNPIWQNAGHIKALQEHLGDTVANVPIYSVIVFGTQATLKFKQPFTRAKVIGINNLLSVIRNEPETTFVSPFRRQKITQLLTELKIEDKKIKKQVGKKHISDIKKDIENHDKKVRNNICPRCGGQLVTRTGKNGTFKGCSNFPKCRFTK
ncbi:NERD domain-containing protein [Bacillus sp. FJAT-29937]|uniref:NERD domain-containing protein n=1 Tax=Bacillus sp. FJAT-29937 TaxID=1720553 RepID=UPI00083222E9|nr:NERD domain-containing protein [Bacillus sp. FJAT-29937]